LNRLADLLKRVVAAIEEAPVPAEKFNFHISRATTPDDRETAVSHIDQYITDINVYRDDAHLAAWRSSGITGQAWEALSYIWRGDANTAAALAKTLSTRGYDAADYEAALQDLAARGWVSEVDDSYQITATGKKVRDEAEEQTERNFLVGWATLNADETVALKNLLTQFKESLNQMTAEKATAVFSDLRSLTGSISRALYTLTRSGVNLVVEAASIEKPGHANLLILSSVFDKPVTAEIMRKRSPYNALSYYHEGFTVLTEMDLMSGDENGYSLTENGRSLVNNILEAFHAHLGAIQPTLTDDMPLEEWNRLADLLERLDSSLLNASDPPGTWCIDHVQGLPMPDEPVALARIDKVLDDINAFRDDAHIAAFKPYKVKGHTWELFTALWRKEVTNPAEMAEKYAGRGYAEADYQQALLDLVKRGWVEETEEGSYVVTENASTEPGRSGRSLREEAEAQTDIYFYLPWGRILPDAEEFHTLLNKADTALQKAVEAFKQAVPA
jgi:DNA-binding PadR family transcriptional regulator